MPRRLKLLRSSELEGVGEEHLRKRGDVDNSDLAVGIGPDWNGTV